MRKSVGGSIDDCLWGDQHCWSWGGLMIASEVIASEGINTIDPLGGIDDHLWGDQHCWSWGDWQLPLRWLPLRGSTLLQVCNWQRGSTVNFHFCMNRWLQICPQINRGNHLFMQKWKLTVDPLFVDDCGSPHDLCASRTFRAKNGLATSVK